MGLRALALATIVAVGAVVAIVVVGGDGDTAEPGAIAAKASDEPVEAACASGFRDRGGPRRPSGDAAFGPLVLLGGRRWAGSTPQAFDGHGYKIPASLAGGASVTLSVPDSLRGRVKLVYARGAWSMEPQGADAVRFTPCPVGGAAHRTGWPGGLVVDRPRCVVLVATLADGTSIRRRLPLGRRC